MRVDIRSRVLLANSVIVTLNGVDVTNRCVAADDVEGWAEVFRQWPPVRGEETERVHGTVKIELRR